MDFRADLHCHSTCSDGSLLPTELVDMAVDIGLQGLSITDHDTVAAYGTAMQRAEEAGLKLLPGVEFSTSHKDISVHVLGYAFDPRNKEIIKFCNTHIEERRRRNKKIIELLIRKGFKVSEEELNDISFDGAKGKPNSLGRPHIAQLLMEKGHVTSIQQAFDKYIGDNKSCYEPGKRHSVEETIDLIHRVGGKAVIAHPHLIKRRKIVRDLMAMDFDGLEAFYAKMPLHQEQPWIDRAREKGWIATGGSDYHGSVKPKLSLGCSWVSDEIFNYFYDIYLRNKKEQEDSE